MMESLKQGLTYKSKDNHGLMQQVLSARNCESLRKTDSQSARRDGSRWVIADIAEQLLETSTFVLNDGKVLKLATLFYSPLHHACKTFKFIPTSSHPVRMKVHASIMMYLSCKSSLYEMISLA